MLCEDLFLMILCFNHINYEREAIMIPLIRNGRDVVMTM